MEYTFCFESKFRIWRSAIKYLKFQTPDGTEFILSEEWILTLQRRKRTAMQRLIFLKRSNYANIYRVTVEVSSAFNQATGKIVLLRKTKPVRTSIIILLSDFQKLRYPVQDTVILEAVEICERIMHDTFKYKITIIRLDESRSEIETHPGKDIILTMSHQLHSLLETGEFADILITDKKGDCAIKAHRNILAARSDYFKRMFQYNWRENVENRVVIYMADMKVMKEILHYLYSGVIRQMEFSVMLDMYKASHKYLLDDLKELLCTELKKYLNIENAVGIYVLAYHALDQSLKDASLTFINNNFNDIQETKFWIHLLYDEDYFEILDRRAILDEIFGNVNNQ